MAPTATPAGAISHRGRDRPARRLHHRHVEPEIHWAHLNRTGFSWAQLECPATAVWVEEAGSRALLRQVGAGSLPELLVDIATAAPAQSLPTGLWTLGTDAQGRATLARVESQYPDDHLISMAGSEREPAIGGQVLPRSLTVERIVAGRLAVSTDVSRFRIFDRRGHPLSDDIDGFLHYLDSGYLVTFVGRGDVGFQVYRIG